VGADPVEVFGVVAVAAEHLEVIGQARPDREIPSAETSLFPVLTASSMDMVEGQEHRFVLTAAGALPAIVLDDLTLFAASPLAFGFLLPLTVFGVLAPLTPPPLATVRAGLLRVLRGPVLLVVWVLFGPPALGLLVALSALLLR